MKAKMIQCLMQTGSYACISVWTQVACLLIHQHFFILLVLSFRSAVSSLCSSLDSGNNNLENRKKKNAHADGTTAGVWLYLLASLPELFLQNTTQIWMYPKVRQPTGTDDQNMLAVCVHVLQDLCWINVGHQCCCFFQVLLAWCGSSCGLSSSSTVRTPIHEYQRTRGSISPPHLRMR